MTSPYRWALWVLAAGLLPAQIATAKPVPIASVTASASLEQDGYTFEPASIGDGRLYTFWVAGGQGGGLSDNLDIKLDGTHRLTGMEIWNGCQVDQDSYDARARASKMTLKIGFGEEVVEVADTFGKQTIQFDEPQSANKIRIFFKGMHHGESWDQIAISEIRFLTDDPEEYVTGTTATASSQLEGDDYAAANLVDTFIDSMWCEGAKDAGAEDSDRRAKKGQPATTSMDRTRSFTQEGGGAGEWFKVDLPGATAIDKIGIVIGDIYDHQTFSQSSRPAALTVRFDDGSSQEWALEDTADWQFLDLGGKSIRWAKFEIDSVTLGTRYNDTAVGEVRFWAR